MSTPRKRTRDGCWTCKTRRQKCDNARPTCQNCRSSGRECGGFEVRLRWGTGIASRGKFSGAEKPAQECVRGPAGRQRDQKKLTRQTENLQTVERSKTREQDLFDEFLRSGIKILHASAESHDGEAQLTLASNLPILSQRSKSLYAVCVALQSVISTDDRSQTLEYLDDALGKFRTELAGSRQFLDDATWTAGLLLCSIGILHGLSWTMHVRGMDQIMKSVGLEPAVGQQKLYHRHLMEVMGVMDIPTFTLGRQTPTLNVWNQNCQAESAYGQARRSETEPMSGLPRSMLDIFARMESSTTEADLWNWPGAHGSYAELQLWEAYRLAGILYLRQTKTATFGSNKAPLSNSVLVARICSCLDAIYRSSQSSEETDKAALNAIIYPSVIAGLMVEVMNLRPEWKSIIRKCVQRDSNERSLGEQNRLLLTLLEELWERDDASVDVNALLLQRGSELSLL